MPSSPRNGLLAFAFAPWTKQIAATAQSRKLRTLRAPLAAMTPRAPRPPLPREELGYARLAQTMARLLQQRPAKSGPTRHLPHLPNWAHLRFTGDLAQVKIFNAIKATHDYLVCCV